VRKDIVILLVVSANLLDTFGHIKYLHFKDLHSDFQIQDSCCYFIILIFRNAISTIILDLQIHLHLQNTQLSFRAFQLLISEIEVLFAFLLALSRASETNRAIVNLNELAMLKSFVVWSI